MKKYFTCISYDSLDFLIPSEYITAGIYLHIPKDKRTLNFNNEILPHIFIGNNLEQTFNCKQDEESCAVLLLSSSYFSDEISSQIEKITEIKPSSAVALSMTGRIDNHEIDLSEFRLFPKTIRQKLHSQGISAVHFENDGRSQLLISIDSLLKEFLDGGLL